MSPERWDEVRRHFERLCELPVEERQSALEAACADDADLFAQVQRLLNAEVSPAEFLSPPDLADLPRTAREARGDLTGTQLGPWTLEQELGRGGMGVVWLGRNRHGEEAAIKLLPPHLLRTGEMVERFRREALLAASVRHPGLVRILGFGEEQGTYYLVMERVTGPSLREWMDDPGLRTAANSALPDLDDPQQVARLAHGVALALEAIHRAGLIHRDIKPSNILLDASGAPRLTDFGLARSSDLGRLTRSGSPLGTPHYMSPEQARARRDGVDHRSDLYSLGAVLYELLAKHPPHRGSSSHEVIYSIAHRTARPLAKAAPRTPGPLIALTERLLRRRRSDRYRDASRLIGDLAAFLDGRPVEARPVGPLPRLRDSLEDPKLLRRLVPAGLAAALALGAAGASALRRPADVVPPQKSLELALELDPASAPLARVDAWVRGTGPGLWEHVGGPLQPSPSGILSLPSRPLRLVLTDAQGRFAELLRDPAQAPAAAAPEIVAPRLARPAEVNHDMRLIVGGELTLELQRVDPVAHEPRSLETPVRVAPFWLDLRPVSVGQWRAYCGATGRPLPKAWSKETGDPLRDDQPVAGITLAAARAYAEWSGKRLPTAVEWYAALGAGSFDWAGELTSDGSMGHPSNLSLAPSRLSTEAARRRFTRAGSQPQGPHGLQQLVGGVAELLDTPWYEPAEDAWGWKPDLVTLWTSAWHSPEPVNPRHLRWHYAGIRSTERSDDIGFRCAKSAAPPR